jgi:hypothetical protein
MGRSDLADVRQKWMWRMRRFSDCRLTVAAFCEREQVSVAAFYQWRKKLAQHSDQSTIRAAEASQNGIAVAPIGSQCFLPVKLQQTVSPEPAVLEVMLANGVRLSLPTSDLEALRLTLNIVSRLPADMASLPEDE